MKLKISKHKLLFSNRRDNLMYYKNCFYYCINIETNKSYHKNCFNRILTYIR